MLINFKLLALVFAATHVSALAGINRIANFSATNTTISPSSIPALSAPTATATLIGTSDNSTVFSIPSISTPVDTFTFTPTGAPGNPTATDTSVPSISTTADTSVPVISSGTVPIETPIPTDTSISTPPISMSTTSIPVDSSIPAISVTETSTTAPSMTASVSGLYPLPIPTDSTSSGNDLRGAAQSPILPYTVGYYDSADKGLSAFSSIQEKIRLLYTVCSDGGKADGDWYNLTGSNSVQQVMNMTAKLGGKAFNLTARTDEEFFVASR
ncbi:hypothetical protein HYPSUDRAFT_54293 [Hypholoma sublateritium FD-334 SS-4]|uniref:Uncharacterized protein n=1 Tax=Hypholoma sublateritium (strain FD-334 SS-4) TaxID=945553 RepID=A0A0D2PVM2_HYPSF|nr:hypothetical protein HYPSUDRAFT_54293 [Hypholoma sublateritium FD-334 SS-4]